MSIPAVSIVIPTLNEGDNVLDTIDAILRNSAPHAIEVVVVDDGSVDHSIATLRAWHAAARINLVEAGRSGPARCRNRGAATARAPLLVFMDAHCYAPPGWLTPLVDAAHADPDLAVVGPIISHTGDFRLCGYGGTWHDASLDMSWLPPVSELTEVPFQPAGCQLVRRTAFEAVGGYDEGLVRWGSEDVEFCMRLWLFGHRISVQPASTIYHVFRQQPPYDIDFLQILCNKLRMALCHFDGQRLQRILQHQHRYPDAAEALRRVRADSGMAQRRAYLMQHRRRSADWFCERFGLPI